MLKLKKVLNEKIEKKELNFINEEGDNLLHLAVRLQDKEITKFLLKSGVDINHQNSSGESPFHLIAKYETDTEIIDLAIQYGNPNIPDNDGCTPLFWFINKGNNSAVEKIVNTKYVNYRVKNIDGAGYLHIAAERELMYECLLLLIEYGLHHMNINEKDYWGYTPLHIACDMKNLKAVAALLEYGAREDVLDDNNRSPMDILSEEEKETVEKFRDLVP